MKSDVMRLRHARSPRSPRVLGKATVLLAAAVLALSLGCGQSPTSPTAPGSSHAAAQGAQEGNNAAEEYRSLYAAMGAPLIELLKDARGDLTPELESALSDAQPVLDRLVWATHLERCDWGIGEYGPETLLPHLAEIRELSRLLRADAARAARAGDLDTAADRVAAIVRVSRHVGGRCVIETLVSYAVLAVAMNFVTDHADEWNSSQRRLMLAEFSRIDPVDPFNGNASLAHDAALAARENLQPTADEQQFHAAKQRMVRDLAATLGVLQR